MFHVFFLRGHNVEEAFLETAKKIFQSIQDGRSVKTDFSCNNLIDTISHFC